MGVDKTELVENTSKIHDCGLLSLLTVMAGDEINLTFTML